MLVMPFVMLFSFFIVVIEENGVLTPLIDGMDENNTQPQINNESNQNENVRLSLSTKFSLIRQCLKFMIPLGLVYLFEYFINQGNLNLLNIFLL